MKKDFFRGRKKKKEQTRLGIQKLLDVQMKIEYGIDRKEKCAHSVDGQ